MTERAGGTATPREQPGSHQAHRCTRHSSPSADLIENRRIAPHHHCFGDSFSRLPCGLVKPIMDVGKFFDYLTPGGPYLMAEEREGDLAAAIAATLDKLCVWEGRILLYCTKSPSSGQYMDMDMWVMLSDKHGGKLLQEAMKYGYFITGWPL